VGVDILISVGVILSLVVSVLAVRALGETDVNPVSGVGKLSQVRPRGVTGAKDKG
jgi:hypothetical protein